MKLLKNITSGESWFALFLLSGVFKESIGLSIDISAIFLAVTSLIILKRLYVSPKINKILIIPIVVYLSFSALVFASVIYSPFSELAQDKTIKFLVLTTPSFIFPFLLFKSKESLNRFLFVIASVSTLLALFSLPLILARGSDIAFVGFNEGNYLGLSRVAGIGLVILLFLGLLNNSFKKYRLLFILPILIVLVTLLGSGARMPIIATALAIFLMIFTSVKITSGEIKYPKFYNKIIIVVFILLFPLAWAYRQGYFNSILYRFEVLFLSSNGGASASARTDRFVVAIDLWKENYLFGNGFGSFGGFYSSAGTNDYPHNLFLELLSELGLAGILIFSGLGVVAAVRFIRLSRNKEVRNTNLFITVTIAFLIIFINSMVSGDLNENRLLLTFVAIVCVLPLIFNKETAKQ